MDEKITAVYIMVRQSELAPQDQGSYKRPLDAQKAKCLQFVEAKGLGPVEVYTSRGQLLMDVERGRIARIVVQDLDRLGSNQGEVDALLYEFSMSKIEVLAAQG